MVEDVHFLERIGMGTVAYLDNCGGTSNRGTSVTMGVPFIASACVAVGWNSGCDGSTYCNWNITMVNTYEVGEPWLYKFTCLYSRKPWFFHGELTPELTSEFAMFRLTSR